MIDGPEGDGEELDPEGNDDATKRNEDDNHREGGRALPSRAAVVKEGNDEDDDSADETNEVRAVGDLAKDGHGNQLLDDVALLSLRVVQTHAVVACDSEWEQGRAGGAGREEE